MILELVCVVAKEFSPMDLLEKLPETIIVLTVLVLQRGLEPRPLGRAPPESCPDGVAAVDVDGRRLGELVTSEDHGIIAPIPDYSRDVRWCGVVSAGAELRIDGPKPPTILHPNETAYRDSGVV